MVSPPEMAIRRLRMVHLERTVWSTSESVLEESPIFMARLSDDSATPLV